MLKIIHIVGLISDPDFEEKVHKLEHAGHVEYVKLGPNDLSRHRLRVSTDRGTECAIALNRSERLCNGAILLLEEDRAIVVHTQTVPWLALMPQASEAALELGYLAGSLHWRVEFEGAMLRVAIEGSRQAYLDRLAHLLTTGNIHVIDEQ